MKHFVFCHFEHHSNHTSRLSLSLKPNPNPNPTFRLRLGPRPHLWPTPQTSSEHRSLGCSNFCLDAHFQPHSNHTSRLSLLLNSNFNPNPTFQLRLFVACNPQGSSWHSTIYPFSIEFMASNSAINIHHLSVSASLPRGHVYSTSELWKMFTTIWLIMNKALA